MTSRKTISSRAPMQPQKPMMKSRPPRIVMIMAGLVSTEPSISSWKVFSTKT